MTEAAYIAIFSLLITTSAGVITATITGVLAYLKARDAVEISRANNGKLEDLGDKVDDHRAAASDHAMAIADNTKAIREVAEAVNAASPLPAPGDR